MKTHIQIKNEAEACLIEIEGTIGVPEEWQFDDPDTRVATYERFREEVARIAAIEADEVIVTIRSTGGDVNDALLIHDALCQLNASGSLRDLPVVAVDVISAASRVHQRTGGPFDPTVLPMVEALEKGAGMEDARALVGMGRVRMDGRTVRFGREGMKMSLDGIAKGYIADLGAKHLLRAGVRDFLINAGGDIVAHGSKAGKPWKVAVENPGKYEGRTAYPAVCALKGQAMATSGNYESAAKGFGHLIDPLGRKGVRPVSATVIAPTAMEADALATALCVMEKPLAFIESMPHTSCCLIMPDGSVLRSSRWA